MKFKAVYDEKTLNRAGSQNGIINILDQQNLFTVVGWGCYLIAKEQVILAELNLRILKKRYRMLESKQHLVQFFR